MPIGINELKVKCKPEAATSSTLATARCENLKTRVTMSNPKGRTYHHSRYMLWIEDKSDCAKCSMRCAHVELALAGLIKIIGGFDGESGWSDFKDAPTYLFIHSTCHAVHTLM